MTSTTTSSQRRPRVPSLLTAREPKSTFADLDVATKRFLAKSTVTLFAVMLVVAFLAPLGFMTITSLKTEDQIANQAILPKSITTVTVDGKELDVFTVPLEDGTIRSLAMVKPGRESSVFVDPADPATEIEWVGRWRTLEPTQTLDPTLQNYPDAWSRLDFPRALRNTGVIAGLGMAGTVIASTLVAYGLSRFRMPAKGFVLASLIATIILPTFVTLVPTYALFLQIGWVGTWLPLIAPHFFGNAYNIFLLRQFFLTIPRDLDEAASIDGASPLKTLLAVILPQAKGAVLAVSLFHFFFAWNDFLSPLIYLAGNSDLQPISIKLYEFLGLYDTAIPLVQAGAVLSMSLPIVVFLSLQRIFLGGIDLSGSLK